MAKELHETIDWTVLHGDAPRTCQCHCGAEYRSHHKVHKVDGHWRGIAELPCPKCGRHDNVFSASSDPREPETYTIGPEDIGEIKLP